MPDKTLKQTLEPANANPAFTDAVRYWEPRRVVYNLVLALIVAIHVAGDRTTSGGTLNLDVVLLFVFLAVAANALYCAAYVVDIFLQHTAYAEIWRRRRALLFVIGLIVAMILTRFAVEALF